MTMRKFNEVHWLLAISALLILSSLGLTLWQSSQHTALADEHLSNVASGTVINEPIQPIPLHLELDQGKVGLGKQLFYEPKFSSDNTVACSSCHNLALGGADQLQHPVGINNTVGYINTPTVFNSGFNFRQFWNGRAASLEEQVSGPVHNPIEMASNWDEVISKLNASPEYVAAFQKLYPDGITANNITDAIATFERSLYTPNSRFDQYLRGDTNALTPQEQEGYRLFKAFGCVSCHQGVNVGGNMYQRMGIVRDYFAQRGNIIEADLGRFVITGSEEDRYVFKVPSLRMAALTPPYFHDGSTPTLDGAVQVMAYYQLGRSISDKQIDLLVQFLKTLPGENAELKAEG
jgi:cytochrome c peroxidase